MSRWGLRGFARLWRQFVLLVAAAIATTALSGCFTGAKSSALSPDSMVGQYVIVDGVPARVLQAEANMTFTGQSWTLYTTAGEVQFDPRNPEGWLQFYSDDPELDPDFDPDIGVAYSRSSGLAPYPWPPQRPSTKEPLTDFFKGADGTVNFGDVSDRLKSILAAANYGDYGYYAAPGGFVLVTRLEATNEEGNALSGLARYKVAPSAKGLDDAVRSIGADAPLGYYRFIAFVVTDQPIKFSDEVLSSAEVPGILQTSKTELPLTVAATPMTKQHTVTALIYEFVYEVGDNAQKRITFLKSARLSGRDHLIAAGIFPLLSAAR